MPAASTSATPGLLMSGTSIATALAPILVASAETSAAAMSGDSANNGPTRDVVRHARMTAKPASLPSRRATMAARSGSVIQAARKLSRASEKNRRSKAASRSNGTLRASTRLTPAGGLPTGGGPS